MLMTSAPKTRRGTMEVPSPASLDSARGASAALDKLPDSTKNTRRRGSMRYDIVPKTGQKKPSRFDKRGWILKKATTAYMGMANWQRRYLRLDGDRLYFYDSDAPKDMLRAKKMIDMRKVKCVCYHYDPNAPMKSQKLGKPFKNDKSRFDIYTPGRIFNIKSEHEDFDNSDEWLALLQKCGAHYNPRYDKRFLN